MKVVRIREDTANAPPLSYTENEGEWLSEFKPVMEEEVQRLIISSPDKQCSIDRLPTWLLKKISKAVSGLLAVIYNKSLSEGKVPEHFKSAIVTRLLKKEGLDPDDLSNFRPISNVSLLSKMLEQLVSERLNDHLEVINTLLAVQ